jgi:aminopeptidase
MPLDARGIMIDDFSLTFSEGRVVDFDAAVGADHLRNLIQTDDGASRLGEVALVPYSSPISQLDITFYHTLYDENASCHIALGSAYRQSLEGGAKMDDETFNAHGGNTSLIHTDFMIGSSELDIDGMTKDGRHEPIMRQGEWAFEI